MILFGKIVYDRINRLAILLLYLSERISPATPKLFSGVHFSRLISSFCGFIMRVIDMSVGNGMAIHTWPNA